MKKIIILDRVKQYLGYGLIEETADIEILTAYSNEDALTVHRSKKADLIITELYGLGMNAVRFCSLIREDQNLRRVSVIVCCRSNEIELRESENCRANAVLTLPIDPALLRHQLQQLLAVPSRRECRVTFSARCTRGSLPKPFDCRAENISVTGMLIQASTDLNRGDRINCSLVLPPATSFETQAEIVRTVKSTSSSDCNQYGVRFSRIDPAVRRAIESLVAQNPLLG